MLDCGLREWTIEWAVAKRFPEKFQDKLMQANAIARLEGKLDACPPPKGEHRRLFGKTPAMA